MAVEYEEDVYVAGDARHTAEVVGLFITSFGTLAWLAALGEVPVAGGVVTRIAVPMAMIGVLVGSAAFVLGTALRRRSVRRVDPTAARLVLLRFRSVWAFFITGLVLYVFMIMVGQLAPLDASPRTGLLASGALLTSMSISAWVPCVYLLADHGSLRVLSVRLAIAGGAFVSIFAGFVIVSTTAMQRWIAQGGGNELPPVSRFINPVLSFSLGDLRLLDAGFALVGTAALVDLIIMARKGRGADVVTDTDPDRPKTKAERVRDIIEERAG